MKGRLKRLAKECSLRRLSDIKPLTIGQWLDDAEKQNMSPATRNEYLAAIKTFCNWLVQEKRLQSNPIDMLQKADRSSDRRHVRRALTQEEIAALLDAAEKRPIAQYGRIQHRSPEKNKRGGYTWTYKALSPKDLEECYEISMTKLRLRPKYLTMHRRLGQQRRLFYLLAVSTGLRRKELSSITIGQCELDDTAIASIKLFGKDAKSGKEATIPLRPDVADELREYCEKVHRDKPYTTLLFDRPPTITVFNDDCKAAGIAKYDERGRVVDIHALRTTFGTHLAVAGVHPRVAQAAMRHSRIELTTNFYTDPALLDVAGAVNALPDFTGKMKPNQQAQSHLRCTHDSTTIQQ